MLIPVILTGGCGTRLWPLSREAYPKQFISLIEGQSLFQQTLRRLTFLSGCANPIVVGNEQHRFLIAEQIQHSVYPGSRIILEPSFKGTAPAVTLAAIQALMDYQDEAMLLVLPADHVIEENEGFAHTIAQGLKLAHQGKLVTFGVVPTHPETGYGYIQRGCAITETAGFEIENFIEKPTLASAQEYVTSQKYWWNSGIFLFSAQTFLQEVLLHAPEMHRVLKESMRQVSVCQDFMRPHASDFAASPADSIDYAVMEKTQNAAVVPLQSGWNDVGAWDALAKLYPEDSNGNICIGDVMADQTHGCFIQSNQRLVVALGVQNLVIVETPDAVLILEKSKAQAIKPVVAQLRKEGRKEVAFPRRVNRPWGAFESIDSGERFQVKRITVSVGQRLSLQRHHHRSEHWVVVKGTARVTRGEEIFLLAENQSTYIPIGVNHRLENVGKIPLEIIEVQSGAYLGEDDICRLEDQYGREESAVPIATT